MSLPFHSPDTWADCSQPAVGSLLQAGRWTGTWVDERDIQDFSTNIPFTSHMDGRESQPANIPARNYASHLHCIRPSVLEGGYVGGQAGGCMRGRTYTYEHKHFRTLDKPHFRAWPVVFAFVLGQENKPADRQAHILR